ncbi:helix-turn-helix transcriptional regulator [Rhizorhabdus wittichii DC-6]|nr:helix-turn-helix transcriptional regulator [Rhizorhabdus wittichii DC-6]
MDIVSRYRFTPPIPQRSFIPRAIASRISRSPYPLTFLASPSGFGKSTLMAQAFDLARSEGESARWLNLYHRAAGAEGFSHYLCLSLKDDGEAQDIAPGAGPFGIDDLLAEVDATCRRDGSVSLYLDEVAPGDLDTVLGLSQMIGKHFGDKAKLVVSSRVAPPRLAGVLGDGGIMYTPAELAFSPAEVAELFDGGLPDRDVAALVATTGGWPALIASVRHGTGHSPADHSLGTGGEAGDMIADFVRDLMDVAPSSRDIEVLAAAFAFGNATAPIFEHDDFASAGEIVTRLARDGLVKVRSEGTRLVYEPHAAVRFAVDRLGRRSSQKRMLDIHRSLSTSLVASGDRVGAIRHALETGDLDLLCDLIEAGGGWLLILQWGAPILDAVNAIPIGRLGGRPAMLLTKVYVLMQARAIGEARQLLDEISTDLEPASFPDDEAFHSFQIGYGLIDGVLRSYEMRPIDFPALERLRDHGPADIRNIADAMILNLKGGYQLRDGLLVEAEATGREATLKCQAAKATFVEAYVQLWLGHAHLQSGNTRDASRRFAAVLDIAENCFGADSNQMIAAKVFLAELEFERGEAERAYAIIEAVFDRIEELDPWYEMLRPFYRIASIRVQNREGTERAISFLDTALDRMENRNLGLLSRYLRSLRVEMLVQSERDIQAIERGVGELQHVEPIESAFLNVRVGLKRGDVPAALAGVDALLDQPAVRECARRMITVTVLKAACHAARGEVRAAGDLVAEAQRLATQSDLRGHFEHEVASSEGAVGGAPLLRPDPGRQAMARLPAPRGELIEVDDRSLPRLGPREREVLDCIVEGLSSKEIAWRMSLSVGTVLGYRKSLYRKIGVNCRSAAISYARQSNIAAYADAVEVESLQ